ncbi:hypothetical protein SB757_14575 [Pseudomonas sp. SIMBA_065]
MTSSGDRGVLDGYSYCGNHLQRPPKHHRPHCNVSDTSTVDNTWVVRHYREARDQYDWGYKKLFPTESEQAAVKGWVPVRDFMVRQTHESDLRLIHELAKAPLPATVDELTPVHLVPAFMLSELKIAFQIGFMIFLPFLIIDLIVSSILMSLGMIMVPPITLSLPLKIMLFLLIDGWGLITQTLVRSVV